jgi:hypothetical protein
LANFTVQTFVLVGVAVVPSLIKNDEQMVALRTTAAVPAPTSVLMVLTSLTPPSIRVSSPDSMTSTTFRKSRIRVATSVPT